MPCLNSQHLNFRGKKRSPCRANSSSKEWLCCCHFSFFIFQSKLQALASVGSLSCQAGWAHILENKLYTPAIATLKHWRSGSLSLSCSKIRGGSMKGTLTFSNSPLSCRGFHESGHHEPTYISFLPEMRMKRNMFPCPWCPASSHSSGTGAREPPPAPAPRGILPGHWGFSEEPELGVQGTSSRCHQKSQPFLSFLFVRLSDPGCIFEALKP